MVTIKLEEAIRESKSEDQSTGNVVHSQPD